ncbi:MAG: polysaccharide biosynthesis protein [Saprospiraceae bacterium]
MNKIINLEAIISQITGRESSLFEKDIDNNKAKLAQEIENRNILVIGGAGTIGMNFIKALLRQAKPSKLVVIDINENGLTELVRDIRSSNDLNVPEVLLTYPINFSDSVFKKIFTAEKPFDIIANFAAHKHVRSEKDIFSIQAMVENNVINAYNLLKLIEMNPPKHFFCVSTDKAANPVNIMGASKKLMEDMILSFSDKIPVSTARFANVLFSNGSLPFGFIERVMKKQPFSVPSDVKRFFVSPRESGELCMLACIMGQSGDIFFPKLDEEKDMKPFTLVAEKFLDSLGYGLKQCSSEEEARKYAENMEDNDQNYPVYYFKSDTSGEKAFEEFYTSDENVSLDEFCELGKVKTTEHKSGIEIEVLIENLNYIFSKGNLSKAEIVKFFNKAIPNFEHIEKGKSLDQKM